MRIQSVDVRKPRQVMYSYGPGRNQNELIVDARGMIPDYKIGDTLKRRGRAWTVIEIAGESSLSTTTGMPTTWVYLAEKNDE